MFRVPPLPKPGHPFTPVSRRSLALSGLLICLPRTATSLVLQAQAVRQTRKSRWSELRVQAGIDD